MASRPDPQFLIQYLQNEGKDSDAVQKNARLYDFLRQVWSRIGELEKDQAAEDLTDVVPAGKLLGRGSGSGDGPAEPITVGTNLTLAGTTLNATGGGGGTWTEVEIDFGTVPEYDHEFTITDAAIAPTSKMIVVPSGNAPTGRTLGDWQWDGVSIAAKPKTGSALVSVLFIPGPIVGTRKFFYQVA